MSKHNSKYDQQLATGSTTGHIICIGTADLSQAWVFARLSDYMACRSWLVQEGYPIHFSRPFTAFAPDTFAWWLPIVVQYGIWPKPVVEGFPNE